MITVKIPAAIRVCSPVYMETPHGNMVTGIAARLQPENGTICVFASDEDIWNAPAALVSLVISDPTGAAHLAWWLRSAIARISVSSHAEHLAAAGAGQHYSKFLNAGSVCTAFWGLVESAALGMPVDEAGLALLRDYAHRVAGVTNG